MNDLDQQYNDYRHKINDRLRHIDIPESIQTFRESLEYALQGQGKRIRPVLLLLVGTSLGRTVEDLMPAALAIEILHTFTLVHDDIMDEDNMRRGKATIHEKWNPNTAILSGDGLFALAYRELMRAKHSRVGEIGIQFSEALLKICEGQARDMNFEQRDDVTPREYLDMVELKTGVLLGLSCKIGAMLADADQEIVHRLDGFGRKLGQAFQIQDDVLEISSDEEQMGKSLGSDFAAGKKTYPLTLVLSRLNQDEKKKFISFLKNNSYNRKEVLRKFRHYEALKESKRVILELINSALDDLDRCPDATSQNLNFLVELISNRDH
ncbi:MAG: polyprenyl synthetase family protein [Candidatus Marinimicrobia bacterium]|nr:polyprenyl synthetase family protein [Candidatus Neomarinimicrobiota bacterium]